MEPWVIAILPLLGVVLGVALQFWLGRTGAREQYEETLRFQAYADYLRAVAAAVYFRTDGDSLDAQRDVADAKARIAIYGSVKVVEALSRFEEAGAMISDGPGTQTFVALVSAMRPTGGAVSNRVLELILIGTVQQQSVASGVKRRR